MDNLYSYGRLAVALYYLFFVITQLFVALDFLVLLTYLKYTDQLQPGKAQKVMDSLRKTIMG